MQGDQIIANEAFWKYLSAPTITSGGNHSGIFSLTPDGRRLPAKKCGYQRPYQRCIQARLREINATSGKFSGVIEARVCGVSAAQKVIQGVSIRATNDERNTSTRYTDSATYRNWEEKPSHGDG